MRHTRSIIHCASGKLYVISISWLVEFKFSKQKPDTCQGVEGNRVDNTKQNNVIKQGVHRDISSVLHI